MRKKEEPMQGSWVVNKARVRFEIENFFIFEGILLILIFFMLITTVQGPYVGTYINVDIPIWIVFVYMGSISLLLGFLFKMPKLNKGMDPRLRLFSLVGLVLAGGNMIGMTVLFLFWFGGPYIEVLYFFEPILLLVTLCVSIFYLIYDYTVSITLR